MALEDPRIVAGGAPVSGWTLAWATCDEEFGITRTPGSVSRLRAWLARHEVVDCPFELEYRRTSRVQEVDGLLWYEIQLRTGVESD